MNDFTTDWEKMYDFWRLTKYEFLNCYSYLTEKEYDDTCAVTIDRIIDYDDMPVRD